MKYCINFAKHSNMLDRVDEVLIRYANDITLIIDYIKEHPNQRIIINIDNMADCVKQNLIIKWAGIKEENPNLNFALRIEKYQEDIQEQIEAAKGKIDFFFGNFVRDFDTLQGYLQIGVSDVYIVEHLCFELDKVAAVAHAAGAQIRVFPNIAQSTWNDSQDMKKFWIRPEDITFYEPYVDVFEFFGDQNRVDNSIRIYQNEKQWMGPVSDIIIGFKDDIDNRTIVRGFAERRIKCGKSCLKGSHCQYCDRIIRLTEVLEERHVGLKVDLGENQEILERMYLDDTENGKGTLDLVQKLVEEDNKNGETDK